MERLIAPQGIRAGIFRCLKSGVNPEYPEQGTPQGGVVSPLLANIALNGIESIHRYKLDGKLVEPSIRYADDMVVILRPQDDANAILERISQFLARRGMNVSEKKTKLTAATDGFDFLGWHFLVQTNGKFRCVPSMDNYRAFRQKVKEIVNCPNYGAMDKAVRLAPIVRGWRNYHRFCKMDGARNSLYFIQKRAFKVFNREKKQNCYTSKRFINVKRDKSPYDGDLTYWSERNSKLYDDETSLALKRQNHTCGYCGLKTLSDEKVHLHHVDGNHSNWRRKNLLAVHESCHDYIHMSKSQG